MKSKFYYAVFIGCFWVMNAIAQKKQNIYFLKDNGKYVNTKDSADYIQFVQEPDSGTVLFNVIEYYMNGNMKLMGKSSTVKPINFEGQVISFYSNKIKKRVCSYKSNQLLGDTFDYYPNGKIYQYIKYDPENINLEKEAHIIVDENILAVYDSLGIAKVKDGNGHYQIFDNDFNKIVQEGEVKDGRKIGTWKGNFDTNSFIDDYADGKLIKGVVTDGKGKITTYKEIEKLPEFVGGNNAFGSYLSNSIHYPVNSKKNNIQGRVVLGFVIERDGSITNTKILKSVISDIDAEALRVISQSPKWNPGLQHGVPVRFAYTMPINFTFAQ